MKSKFSSKWKKKKKNDLIKTKNRHDLFVWTNWQMFFVFSTDLQFIQNIILILFLKIFERKSFGSSFSIYLFGRFVLQAFLTEWKEEFISLFWSFLEEFFDFLCFFSIKFRKLIKMNKCDIFSCNLNKLKWKSGQYLIHRILEKFFKILDKLIRISNGPPKFFFQTNVSLLLFITRSSNDVEIKKQISFLLSKDHYLFNYSFRSSTFSNNQTIKLLSNFNPII